MEKNDSGNFGSALSGASPEQKHTPGPWRVYYGATHCQVFPVASERNLSADALTPKFSLDVGNGHANAHLIAAAPDLLAALELIKQHLEPLLPNATDIRIVDAFIAARAAIARATGAENRSRPLLVIEAK